MIGRQRFERLPGKQVLTQFAKALRKGDRIAIGMTDDDPAFIHILPELCHVRGGHLDHLIAGHEHQGRINQILRRLLEIDNLPVQFRFALPGKQSGDVGNVARALIPVCLGGGCPALENVVLKLIEQHRSTPPAEKQERERRVVNRAVDSLGSWLDLKPDGSP